MRIWSASAISHYYLDPKIAQLGAGIGGKSDSELKGYYIVPHCDPECCHAFGGLSVADLGPFPSRATARKWSQKNLVEPEVAERARHSAKSAAKTKTPK